ncbi:hypothetical protein RIF29_38435 [Crotalaria pallida]|uniref:Uncharacterized protein n=1 Tax=Crotalaria pallida TaxID=3830 RepID=A0AAN9HNS1_CROPI
MLLFRDISLYEHALYSIYTPDIRTITNSIMNPSITYSLSFGTFNVWNYNTLSHTTWMLIIIGGHAESYKLSTITDSLSDGDQLVDGILEHFTRTKLTTLEDMT